MIGMMNDRTISGIIFGHFISLEKRKPIPYMLLALIAMSSMWFLKVRWSSNLKCDTQIIYDWFVDNAYNAQVILVSICSLFSSRIQKSSAIKKIVNQILLRPCNIYQITVKRQ